MKSLLFSGLLLLVAVSVQAFPKENCGEQKCADCHSLSRKEAGFLLGDRAERILNIEQSDMPGVWVVEVEKQGQKYPVYIDFTKTHLMQGELIRLKDGENLTTRRKAALNRVAVSRIPLEDALIIGDPRAPVRAIVFTDPQCHFCGKMHEEMKKVVKADPDIAFFIKLFPLNIHPDAYMISKSILCNRSMEMLEASLAGRMVPPPLCRAEEVDETIKLGRELGVRSTPTLVLPDGQILPGYKPAEALLELLGSGAAVPGNNVPN